MNHSTKSSQTQKVIVQEKKKIRTCKDCRQPENNIIYVPGYGYVTYCSSICFKQTQ